MSEEQTDLQIPTYEEYLETLTVALNKEPSIQLAKAAVAYVRYVQTREVLLLNILRAKEIITDEEIEVFMGHEAHDAAQELSLKTLTRQLCQLAATGKLVIPGTDKSLHPDDVLVIINDVLDLNNTGWTGRTVETIAEFRGQGDALRKRYEEEVALLQGQISARKAAQGLSKGLRELREHKLRIYLSKCNIVGVPSPSAEDQQRMIEGELPVPEKP